ncbi:dual specificity tyrosine-phosphorylation-regulated kinase [Acrasis kona]|uniref:dual-specificity kinase n=1 Tax=Acrasis kona TaxID=1008807 RepID=A0AAW2ZD49_9EUKA
MSKLQPPTSANRQFRQPQPPQQNGNNKTQLQNLIPNKVAVGQTTQQSQAVMDLGPFKQTQSGRKKSAIGNRNSGQNWTSTNGLPAAPALVPQPPQNKPKDASAAGAQQPTISNKTNPTPRRYNFESVMQLNIKEAATAGSVKQPLSARPNYKESEPIVQQHPLTAREKQPTPHQNNRSSSSSRKEEVGGENNFRFPNSITPANALKLYDSNLSDFEQSEIFDYPKIYFIGNTNKKIKGTVSTTKNNHGYDDDRGDYQMVMNDHVAYRYEVLNVLGKGSFGQVCKCLDVKHNKLVALKMIRNKNRFHKQALVEVKILEHLRNNDPEKSYHVIEIYSYFYFRNHLCITTELMSINLYEFIMNNKFQGLSLGLIRRFAVQILTSLKYLARERIIHCDLKPENILLKSHDKSAIKVIDFGSSCFEDERMYTYIQSRFYRSPEVILGIAYGRPIDMWSFGCILAELYTGYPLFPGQNELEQLNFIMEILDVPSKKIIDLSTRRKHFFDANNNPRLIINTKSGKKRKPGSKNLFTALRCNDHNFVGFLEGCLRWDPHERFSPDEALRHEWILEGFIPPTPTQMMSTPRSQLNSASSRRTTVQQPTSTQSGEMNSTLSVEKPPSSSSSRPSRNGNLAGATTNAGPVVKRRYNVKANQNGGAVVKHASILPPLIDVKKKTTTVETVENSESNTNSEISEDDSERMEEITNNTGNH